VSCLFGHGAPAGSPCSRWWMATRGTLTPA